MIRIAMSVGAALLVTLVIPAIVLSAPLPASAAVSHRVCETNGRFCLGVANFRIGTPVSERTPGRAIIEQRVPGRFQGLPLYRLAFARFPRKCVGVSVFPADIVAVIRPCSGGTGVIWARLAGRHFDQWINRFGSRRLGFEELLSGVNTNGGNYELQPGGARGWFQKFSNR